MPDIISKETRSRIMASIHSKDTKVELMLRTALYKEGLRYRTHYNIKGHPDIAFPAKRVAIFVDGDFWHGYRFKFLKPKLKNKFWLDKITRNMQRDKEVNAALNNMGWHVMRLWEHQLKKDVNDCICRIMEELKNVRTE